MLRRLRAVVSFVMTVVVLASLAQAAPDALASAVQGTGGQFVPVQGRVLDTRPSYQVGPYNTPMAAGVWRTVTVAGMTMADGSKLPSDMSAVAVNFTVLAPSASGYINADKDEATPNATITYMHYVAGDNQSNSGTLAVAADGKIQVKSSQDTNMTVDIQGYYTADDTPAPGGYVPVTPKRIVDTRNGTGLAKAKLAGGSTTSITVAGSGSGVPTTASAAMLVITTANDTSTANHFYVPYPADEARPANTAMSFAVGVTDTSTSQVGLSTTGSPLGAFKLYLSGPTYSVDVVVDVVGYFAPGSSTGAFTPAAARVYDSKSAGHTSIAAGGTATIPIAEVSGVPAASKLAAVVTQLSVREYGANGGYVEMWASGTTRPSPYSSLAVSANNTISNMVTSQLGTDGAVSLYNSGPDTIDVIVDVEGWYENGSNDLPIDTQITPVTIYDNTSSTGEVFGSGATRQLAFAGQGAIPNDMSSGLGSVDAQVTISGMQGGTAATVSFSANDSTPSEQASSPNGNATSIGLEINLDESGQAVVTNTGATAVKLKLVVTGWESYFTSTDPDLTNASNFSDDGTPSADPLADTDDTPATTTGADPAGASSIAGPAGTTADVEPGTDAYDANAAQSNDQASVASATCSPTTGGTQPQGTCAIPFGATDDELAAEDADSDSNDRSLGVPSSGSGMTDSGVYSDTPVSGTDSPYASSETSSNDSNVYPDTSSQQSTDITKDKGDGQFRAGKAPVPSDCARLSGKYATYYSRTLSCAFFAPITGVYDSDGELAGLLTFHMYELQVTNMSDYHIETIFTTVLYKATGAAQGVTFHGQAVEYCFLTNGAQCASHVQSVTYRPGKYGHAYWVHSSGKPASGAKVQSRAGISFSLTGTASDGSVIIAGAQYDDNVLRRVDNFPYLQRGIGGVLPAKQMIWRGLSVNDARVTKSARFVRWAQNAINGSNSNGPAHHPGKYVAGAGNTPLTRIDPGPGDVNKRRNSYWSCKGVPKQSGNDCDEYPFASTRNGGYLFRPPLSKGSSIPSSQNQTAGSMLGQFLRGQRIAYGDRYWVQVR